MEMQSLSLFTFQIPMQTSFAHALHTHTQSEGVLLRVDFKGIQGWGEAAPREYVTGESVQSVTQDVLRIDFQSFAKDLLHCGFDEALILVKNLEYYLPEGQSIGPSTHCMVELAILDALLKSAGMNFVDLYHYLRHLEANESLSELDYTWVCDLQGKDVMRELLANPNGKPPKRIKIKVDRDLDKLEQTLDQVRCLAPELTISLDVNEGWEPNILMQAGDYLQRYQVAFVEEPTKARSWQHMAEFRRAYQVPIMLDESFANELDIEQGIEQEAFDILNIRLSKCGGFMAAVRYLEQAESLGKGVYFGVHVGEVGPLLASQRALAACAKNSFGIEVGKHDQWFAHPTIRNDYGIDRSTHTAKCFHGFGHGIEPSEFLLRNLQSVNQINTC